jgi:signal transduction histidine kinase/ligand-binding sensor domain-containing protein
LLVAFASIEALAVNPDYRLTQYAHTAWRVRDGAIGSAPQVITQTRDGFIWIGTLAGLVRFDGEHFEKFPDLNVIVGGLLAEDDGSLWIGSSKGLLRLKAGEIAHYGDLNGQVNWVTRDRQGVIWYVRSHLTGDDPRPLCRVDSTTATCFGNSDGISPRNLHTVSSDANGSLWLGNGSGLFRWKPGESQSFISPGLAGSDGLFGVSYILPESDGSVLVGIGFAGPGLGLQRLVNGEWSSYVAPGLDGSKLEVTALLRDRDNSLWIGTENDGVYRVQHGQVDHFNENNGLSGNNVETFWQDHEGNMWVVTTDGIDAFRDRSVNSYSTREGLSANEVDSVLGGTDGDVWIGNHNSLDRLHEGHVSSISKSQGLSGTRVTSLLEDHIGRIWVGVDHKLTIYDGHQFREVTRADGTDMGVVTSLIEDVDHDVWGVAFRGPKFDIVRIHADRIAEIPPAPKRPRRLTPDPKGGVLIIFEGGLWGRYRNGQLETFTLPIRASLPQGSLLRSFAVGPDDAYYAATDNSGIISFRGDSTRLIDESRGLPCNGVFDAIVDSKGNLWASAPCGIIEVPASELDKLWREDDSRLSIRLFDILDGAITASPDFRPAISETPDGKIWFANPPLLQMIDPNHLPENTIAPPVHIESITADHKAFMPDHDLRFPALTRQLELDYAALSFVIPQKVQYKYILEGHDAAWQDAGTRRQAFYNDLPPGKYTFRVTAANNSGVWNEVGDSVAIFIAPAWYQTVWFRSAALVSLLMIAWAAYQLRLRQINATLRLRYNERLDERTRMARDLHDTLLQTIQGSKLAAENALASSNDPSTRQSIEKLIAWLGRAVDEGRAALNALRYSRADTSDLAAALRVNVDENLLDGRMQTTFEVSGEPCTMQPVVRDEVYLICYEAIRNACAHSGGTLLHVSIHYGRDLMITIRDNGKGIDSSVLDHGREDHHGLSGMRERAARIGATLEVSSSNQTGTEVSLKVSGDLLF